MSNITKNLNIYKDVTNLIGARSFGKEDLVVPYRQFNGTKDGDAYILPAYTVGNYSWEFNVKIRLSESDISGEFRISDTPVDLKGFRLSVVDGKFSLLVSIGSRWVVYSGVSGIYDVIPNTTYWIKVGFNAATNEYYLSYSLDNVTFTKDISYTSSDKHVPYTPQKLYIKAIKKIEYLEDCYMIVNGVEVWRVIERTSTISRDDMQNYVLDGITVTPVVNDNKAVIDFSNVKLPWKFEHSDKLLTSRFAIAPLGTTVTQPKYVKKFNGTTIGSPTVTEDSIASGFSSSNYLRVPSQSFGSANNWEILFKVKTGNSTSTNQKIFHTCSGTGSAGRFGIGFIVIDNHFGFFLSSNNSSWLFDLVGSYRVLPNTTYYIKASFSGTQYKLSYSLDNVTFIDDIIYDSTSKAYSSLPNAYIGIYSTSYFQDPWLGTLDLNECYIKINDEEVWSGTKWVDRVLNVNKVGSLAVTEDFIASGFSSSSYLTASTDNLGNNCEYFFKATTSSDISPFQNIMTVYPLCEVYVEDGQLKAWNESGVNSPLIAGDVNTNSTYYVRISQKGGKLQLGYSEDNVNWTYSSAEDTACDNYEYFRIGWSVSNLNWRYWRGSIDLKECYIKINGEEVWRGAEDLGTETLKGCVRYYFGHKPDATTPPEDSSNTYNIYAVNGDEGVVLDSKWYDYGGLTTRPILGDGPVPDFEKEWYLGEYRVETGEEGSPYSPDGGYFPGGGIVLT